MPESCPLPMSRTSAFATDLVVGIAAGLAASFAMNLFQAAWSQVAASPAKSPSATERAADAVSVTVAGKATKRTIRRTFANVIHYTTGALVGGVYGAASGLVPALTWGRGTLFAGGVWIASDELAVPALGLAPTADKTELKEHVFGLASHIVFGLTLDLVRRQLNGLISARR
jgi:putative membrane protein